MTRDQALDFLLTKPVEYAKLLGFTKLEKLHNDWILDMVRGQEDETLQAHRGSYKTTCVSVALAMGIFLLPNKRSLFMRKTDTDVKEIIRQTQNILKDPHTQYFVQSIYGTSLRLTTETATEINTNLSADIKGTAQLVGFGLGSSLTGKHFDRIYTDDIVNVTDRVSKAERDRTKLMYQELQNVKNRGGRIFNTGTPWHKDDCFNIMPEAKKYSCYDTGLITPEELEKIKAKMVASLFAANYELRHIAAEDVIFANPKTGADIQKVEQGKCHVDAAYGGADYTAFTICRKENGTYYVLGKLYQKHVDDVMEQLIDIRQSVNAGRISCENNGDKGYLGKALRAKGERTHVYHENMNKYLKITTYLKAEWDNVVFVEGTDEEYIQQVLDYNENAEHDDAPDSLASIIREQWRQADKPTKPQDIYLL